MTIDKLPSGSYRVRDTIDGVRYTVTFKKKPNAAEIANAFYKKSRKNLKGTFLEAAETYIAAKEKTLSPTTIRAYKAYLRNIPDDFVNMQLADVDSLAVQKLINSYAEHSPKYIRNVYGFIRAVVALFDAQAIISVSIPQTALKRDVRPSTDDIKRIIKEAEETPYEVALWLAIYGLRRSEQICLTEDDLNGNILTINKAMVQDSDAKWIVKDTKTPQSCREIYLDDYVVNLIHEKGFYKGHPNSIIKWLYRTQDKLGIERFSLHFFRHYFASRMSTVTDEATVLKLGGWKTDFVMKNCYRYAIDENIEKAQKASAELISDLHNWS